MAEILNFNIGVLGHVDSGKTSLSKGLSTIASTAAFDKNPESKARGITLDLGFSSFSLEAPEQVKSEGYSNLQITLVDCPGHASLIKTIIGGAQIINLMMLVVDVTKGMQTQTAECLVIGQITSDRMIVVLNKTDMLPKEKRAGMIEKMTKRLRQTLQNTKFSEVKIIPVSAKPGGPDSDSQPEGLDILVDTIKSEAYIPKKVVDASALFAVDHCFSIKGQGTVMTGTVLQGKIKVGDTLEIPSLAVSKKVKSMQMFRKSVDNLVHGDRAGICVTQFDPTLLERGLVCAPGSIHTAFGIIVDFNLIRYFKSDVKSKAKFHISLGHETVMAKITLFSCSKCSGDSVDNFDFSKEYQYEECYSNNSDSVDTSPRDKYVLLEFETAVPVVPNCIVIGSKLDSDVNANICRLAFHGKALKTFTNKDYSKTDLPNLKIYKDKQKEGIVERASNEYEVIVKELIKKETNLELFTGLKVELSTGEKGVIEGSFGQSGKIKVRVMEGLKPETYAQVGGGKKKKCESGGTSQSIFVNMKFKRYIFDEKKRMIQL